MWTCQNMTWPASSAKFGAIFHCSFARHGHHLDVLCDIRYVLAYIPYDIVVFAETSVQTRAMSILTFWRTDLLSHMIACLIGRCQYRC